MYQELPSIAVQPLMKLYKFLPTLAKKKVLLDGKQLLCEIIPSPLNLRIPKIKN